MKNKTFHFTLLCPNPRHVYDGLSMIECIIYCFLVALISLLLFHFFLFHSQKFMSISHNGQTQMQLYSTCCLLERTISMAYPARQFWDTSYRLIFRTATGDIGWEFENHNIYQIAGTYDFTHHGWITKSKSLIAQQVAAFEFHPIIVRDQIQSIRVGIDWMDSIARYETTIFLINRIL